MHKSEHRVRRPNRKKKHQRLEPLCVIIAVVSRKSLSCHPQHLPLPTSQFRVLTVRVAQPADRIQCHPTP